MIVAAAETRKSAVVLPINDRIDLEGVIARLSDIHGALLVKASQLDTANHNRMADSVRNTCDRLQTQIDRLSTIPAFTAFDADPDGGH